MSRYTSVRQRGRPIATCPECKDKVWSTQKSLIVSADPLTIVHEKCPRNVTR